jgi:catechol 2,3-dioxygenase-like lactoylglutathione lyase family enzyme
MIAYSTLGTNDMDRAIAFYDPVFAAIGGKREITSPEWTSYGRDGERAKFVLTQPYNRERATSGNGAMLAFRAESRAAVDAFHAAALANGGSDEGRPGVREETTYAAYVRDPDGNKLLAYIKEK